MFKAESLTGKRFGKLIAHEREHRKNSQTYYRCICDCGGEKWVRRDKLIGFITLSCGCIKYKNIIGQKFNKLTPIQRMTVNRRGYYKCYCECGREAFVRHDCLINGATKSCGCIGEETSANKRTGTRLYRIYQGMKARCYYPKAINFNRYGERGIKICDEWLGDYNNFRDWALQNGYEENLSIDRIDNNGDYNPDNCRWVDNKTQSRNRRNNVKALYKGELMTLPEIADITGLSNGLIWYRNRQGIDFDKPNRQGE